MNYALSSCTGPSAGLEKRMQVFLTGSNGAGHTVFLLKSPLRDVTSCRLVWANVPATAGVGLSTAVHVKVGDRSLDKVVPAVPAAPGPDITSATAEDFMAGKAYFFVMPNGVELYRPAHEMDEKVIFTPELPGVQSVEVEIYAIPPALKDNKRPRVLLDLADETFAMVLEFTCKHR